VQRTGIAQNTISVLEHGKNKPQDNTLYKLSRALGVEKHELLKPPPQEVPERITSVKAPIVDEMLMKRLARDVHTGTLSAADAIEELRRHNLLRPRSGVVLEG